VNSKIGFISMTYPPFICGVGDHTFYLAQALSAQHEVHIWTKADISTATPQKNVILHNLNERTIASEINRQEIEKLIIQYTPQLYTPMPWKILLPLWKIFLNPFIKTRMVLSAHEVNYPIEFSLPGVVLSFFHLFLFFIYSLRADKIIFSMETTANCCRKLIFWKKNQISWSNVGNNIPYFHSSAPIVREKILLSFGTSHPGHLYKELLETFAEVLKIDSQFKLYFIGVEQNFVAELLRTNNQTQLSDKIVILGKINAKDVSLTMQKSLALLAPLEDGVSPRRGSIVAAFEHQLPVFTNKGFHTSATTPWNDFLFVADNASLFSQLVTRNILNSSELINKANKAQTYASINMSWKKISNNF
jgi:glycosyltransferase involved in cell wall biosynthesis